MSIAVFHEAPDPTWPRYSARPFPAYRFHPGQTAHPRRDPNGHSYGLPEPHVQAFSEAEWAQSTLYLLGIDLYNFAYWWESHEVFEALWHAAGTRTPLGLFLQALIQLAAGNLKEGMGGTSAAHRLWGRAVSRLETYPNGYLGVEVPTFCANVRAHIDGTCRLPALIRLAYPAHDGRP